MGLERLKTLLVTRIRSYSVNKLANKGDNQWHLPRHAYIIVYETETGEEFLTIYDCGAAQKPPTAQITGNLIRVKADHETEKTQTGYIVRMMEKSILKREDEKHWIIEAKSNGN